MPKFINAPKLLPPEVIDRFKYEIASEIGIQPQIQSGYWGEVPSRDCGRVGGKIGGNMVKVMIKRAQELLDNGQF